MSPCCCLQRKSTIACQLTPTAVLTLYVLKSVLDLMSNFFICEPKILKIDVRVRIQYTCPNINNVKLKSDFRLIFFQGFIEIKRTIIYRTPFLWNFDHRLLVFRTSTHDLRTPLYFEPSTHGILTPFP